MNFLVLYCFFEILLWTNDMCLAVPSKIIEINDSTARVEVDGVVREASIMLLDDVDLGDYVIVHAGFAISKVDEEAALQTIADMRQILELGSGPS